MFTPYHYGIDTNTWRHCWPAVNLGALPRLHLTIMELIQTQQIDWYYLQLLACLHLTIMELILYFQNFDNENIAVYVYTLPLWNWYLTNELLKHIVIISRFTPYHYGIDTIVSGTLNVLHTFVYTLPLWNWYLISSNVKLWISPYSSFTPYHYGIDTRDLGGHLDIVSLFTPYHYGIDT